jgi:hypothetical protein
MSVWSWAAKQARDNALVSPWAQGNLAYSEARGPSGPQQSPNPADRPGFYSGGAPGGKTGTATGGAPAPAPGNNVPWTGVAGGINGGARGPNAPTPTIASTPGGFKAGIARTGGAGAGNGAQGGTPAPAGTGDPYGYASGPTYLENRYLSRLFGTDPAYEYALKRGGNEIDDRMAAGGSYNSGARGQQLSDFAANAMAQSEGQLDSLAAGATGARQSSLNSMFGTGGSLASGQSGINSAYDLAAGGAMSNALSALLGYTTSKAGVDSKSNQQGWNNVIGLASLA